ncbi:MAG TPA: DNA cytosine methyltransferase [Acidobacteriaceae bacterium]
MYNFYEFFAGGGMARAGLGSGWKCLFSNDFDHKKAAAYRDNWGDAVLKVADVGTLSLRDIPETADLAWASFPCQDLSLAGGGAGLKGDRSGTFRPFWKLMTSLIGENRAPQIVVLENVCGALTSHGGEDFSTLCDSLVKGGYSVGAVIIDAAHFVPQSRARLFVIGVKANIEIPRSLAGTNAMAPWHPPALIRAFQNLPSSTKEQWVWWHMPLPKKRVRGLTDIVEWSTDTPPWFSEEETKRLLEMMAPIHRAKVMKATRFGKRVIGSIYKRTRPGEGGSKHQRAEVRFDDISGCLRTPSGGSSRQLIIVVEGNNIKVRLISARETARLMGLDDDYVLPNNYNEAYHLTGDGVVVPAVRHLAKNLLEPLIVAADGEIEVAA